MYLSLAPFVSVVSVLICVIVSHAAGNQVCLPGDASCSAASGTEAIIDIDTIELRDAAELQDNHKEPDDIFDDNYDNDDDYDGEMLGDKKKEDLNCVDEDRRCEFWAREGECQKNPNYMLTGCRKSCNSCGLEAERIERPAYGEAQDVSGEHRAELVERVKKIDIYMTEVVSSKEYDKVRSECKNRHELCVLWAFLGECEANPSYMLLNCAPSCETCNHIDYDFRCPNDPDMKSTNIFREGDLHRMFERIVETEANVTILSRPEIGGDEKRQNLPWVITLDGFVSDEECQQLIHLGGAEGYERSTDVGAKKFDGTYEAKQSKTRTSENAWCTKDCYNDPSTQSVLKKIETLTGVPDENSEYLQLLRYQTGQFYRTHHDYIEHDQERSPGPRMLTAFLYLNDVEAGGGTNFPQLDITVMPKKGRILLWPSVLNSDPSKKDFSTNHQALTVEAGVKFAANAWIHLRNFKKPHEEGCT